MKKIILYFSILIFTFTFVQKTVAQTDLNSKQDWQDIRESYIKSQAAELGTGDTAVVWHNSTAKDANGIPFQALQVGDDHKSSAVNVIGQPGDKIYLYNGKAYAMQKADGKLYLGKETGAQSGNTAQGNGQQNTQPTINGQQNGVQQGMSNDATAAYYAALKSKFDADAAAAKEKEAEINASQNNANPYTQQIGNYNLVTPPYEVWWQQQQAQQQQNVIAARSQSPYWHP